MIETNMRIIKSGPQLELTVRPAKVHLLDRSASSIKRICGKLRYEKGVAATPLEGRSTILVLTSTPIGTFELQGRDLRAKVEDEGKSRTLRFKNPSEAVLMARLLKQQLLLQTRRSTDLWTLDSPRIFYESNPRTWNGIASYRRYGLTTIPIENVGVGITVDITTAFFTTHSVAWFFDENVSERERERRREHFEQLSERQKGQKGTLLYERGKDSRGKCYFDEYLEGVRCDDPMTGSTFGGRSYSSLLDYYQQRYGHLDVSAEDPVAMVSFRNGPGPVPVSACLLRLRVMNDMLPDRLKGSGQMKPYDRKRGAKRFWKLIGAQPFGRKDLVLEDRFWKPEGDRVFQFQPPGLEFGDGQIAKPPSTFDFDGRQRHYWKRKRLLNEHGCFDPSLTVARIVHFCVPDGAGEEVSRRLAREMTECLSRWTKHPIEPELSLYNNRAAELTRLSKDDPRMVVFVFEDDDPAAYYIVEHELSNARVKRIRLQTLVDAFGALRAAEENAKSRNGKFDRAKRDWDLLVEQSALDVLQQLGCVPWTIRDDLHYDAQLAIDVGAKRRFFALSLIVCRNSEIGGGSGSRRVVLDTKVFPKPNASQERISKVVLRKKLVSLFKDNGYELKARPPRSLLVLRDGRECGEELQGIQEAQHKLVKAGLLQSDPRVDVVDFHKKTLKGIRVWDNDDGYIRQAFEGTAVLIDGRTAGLINTGAPTLRQGTAKPLLLKAQTDDVNIKEVAHDVHACSHLTWTSPGSAQRLPLAMKRTDDELQSRAAQEILRVS